MEALPISRTVSPPEGNNSRPQPRESILRAAKDIKDYFFQNTSRIFSRTAPYQQLALRERPVVYDSDLILARKYAWAVLAYEKIFERGEIKSSPGPGNGYFDTVQILMEQIEILSRKFGLSNDIDRSQYYPMIEKLFPDMPALTRGLFPAILYFVALRILEIQDTKNAVTLQSDFWYVTVPPSKKIQLAANLLHAASKNMFNSLRNGEEESFRIVYDDFERYWTMFYEQLQIESTESSLFPDLEISFILKLLPNCKLYAKRKARARRIAEYFDEGSNKVVLSIVKYPERLTDTYENNRAYNHARMLIAQASHNLVEYVNHFCYEVTILTFPRM